MRRAAAVLTLFLLLQWTLGGATHGCDSGGRGVAHASMGAMPQHATHHTGGDHGSCGDHAGMTPDAQCAMAAGCATSGALVPALAVEARVVAAHDMPPAFSWSPSSWNARPQTPPPKA